MIKILFICHGNICRSTMAESVLTYLVKQRHIDHLFEIYSAATSREEIGNGPHYGTVNKLHQKNIPVIPHRAVQMTKADYEHYDYLIGMDSANIRNMNRIADGDPALPGTTATFSSISSCSTNSSLLIPVLLMHGKQ